MCNVVRYLLFLSCIYVESKAHESGYSLLVEHAIGEGEFQKQGEIHFLNLKGEDASIRNQVELTQNEYKHLEKLAENGGIYRLRMSTKLQEVSSQKEQSSWVSTFTYAKLLLDADMRHALNIHTDGLGNIISIGILSIPCLECGEQNLPNFETEVMVFTPNQAQIPDTAGFLSKIEEEKRKKEKQASEPQSFLGKYWMFIVPVVFFVMMSNAAQQQQG